MGRNQFPLLRLAEMPQVDYLILFQLYQMRCTEHGQFLYQLKHDGYNNGRALYWYLANRGHPIHWVKWSPKTGQGLEL